MTGGGESKPGQHKLAKLRPKGCGSLDERSVGHGAQQPCPGRSSRAQGPAGGHRRAPAMG